MTDLTLPPPPLPPSSHLGLEMCTSFACVRASPTVSIQSYTEDRCPCSFCTPCTLLCVQAPPLPPTPTTARVAPGQTTGVVTLTPSAPRACRPLWTLPPLSCSRLPVPAHCLSCTCMCDEYALFALHVVERRNGAPLCGATPTYQPTLQKRSSTSTSTNAKHV